MLPTISRPDFHRQGALVNSKKKMSAHLQVDHYGDFRLTDAVRPSLDLQVVPRQGYRVATFRDAKANLRVPVLAASVSSECLFDRFHEGAAHRQGGGHT